MKKINATALFLCLIFFVNAQQLEPLKIAVMDFDHDPSISALHAEEMRNSLNEYLFNDDRFELLDRSKVDEIRAERELSMLNPSEIATQGFALGADYIILVKVHGKSYYDKTEKNIKDINLKKGLKTGISRDLRIKVNYSFQLIKTESATVLVTDSDDVKTTGNYSEEELGFNPPEPMMKARYERWVIRKVGNEIYDDIEKHFPMVLRIVELEDVKKEKAREVIAFGKQEKGQRKFIIYALSSTVQDGQTFEKEAKIGELVIQERTDELFAICQVKEGEKEIYQNFKAGNTLICKPKPGALEKMGNLMDRID